MFDQSNTCFYFVTTVFLRAAVQARLQGSGEDPRQQRLFHALLRRVRRRFLRMRGGMYACPKRKKRWSLSLPSFFLALFLSSLFFPFFFAFSAETSVGRKKPRRSFVSRFEPFSRPNRRQGSSSVKQSINEPVPLGQRAIVRGVAHATIRDGP